MVAVDNEWHLKMICDKCGQWAPHGNGSYALAVRNGYDAGFHMVSVDGKSNTEYGVMYGNINNVCLCDKCFKAFSSLLTSSQRK